MIKPTIVAIPEKMEKYYGKGKMLHPEIGIIENAISLIPPGKLTTIDILAKKLARDFGTDVTCPMRTLNAIKNISNKTPNSCDEKLPYWRVISKDKLVIKSKSHKFCADKLKDEGFEIEFTKKGSIKVNFQSQDLYQF